MATLSATRWPNKGTVEGNQEFLRVRFVSQLPGQDFEQPAASAFDPPDGSVIAEDETLSLHIEDNVELAAFFVSVSVDGGPYEVVYDLGGPGQGFSVLPTGDSISGYDLSFTRDAGWFGDVSVSVGMLDTAGNSQIDGWDLIGPEPAPPADVTPPVISNVQPLPGQPISPSEPITFRVTDETELALIAIWVELAGEDAPEVVYTGTRFSNRYANGSSREATAGGWDYTIYRLGGWPSSFSLEAKVLDAGGNEAIHQGED